MAARTHAAHVRVGIGRSVFYTGWSMVVLSSVERCFWTLLLNNFAIFILLLKNVFILHVCDCTAQDLLFWLLFVLRIATLTIIQVFVSGDSVTIRMFVVKKVHGECFHKLKIIQIAFVSGSLLNTSWSRNAFMDKFFHVQWKTMTHFIIYILICINFSSNIL